jgi:hypothetical protein
MGSLFINGSHLVIVLGIYLYAHIMNGYVQNYFNYSNVRGGGKLRSNFPTERE